FKGGEAPARRRVHAVDDPVRRTSSTPSSKTTVHNLDAVGVAPLFSIGGEHFSQMRAPCVLTMISTPSSVINLPAISPLRLTVICMYPTRPLPGWLRQK